MQVEFKIGDKVHCKCPSIDENIGDGETGFISGFARFSQYHGKEALVKFQDGRSGWFWVTSLDPH